MCVGGVPLFCAKEAFNARFGTPDYLKTSIQAASVEYRQYCGYTFGTALFREYEDGWEWCGIYLYDTGIDGPRGIRVGDTLDRLFSVFPGEAECVTGDSVIFYRSNANDGSLIALPPSGEMIISGGEPIAVYYDFPEDPDWRDHAWDYDEYNYVYQSHVSLKFQISNRLITGIVIYTGPYAE